MEKLKANKINNNHQTIIKIKDVIFGDGSFNLIAGPCSIESYEQLDNVAKAISKNGGKILRGGAYKIRTSPYDFQGLHEEGINMLYEIAKTYNLVTVSEIISVDQIDLFKEKVDIIQIGARNMFNLPLIKAVAKTNKPILLKRGSSATIKEWLLVAEYILNEGNNQVILCERGIRTFETYTRYTLDISAVLAIKELSHLPIVVDPSHGTGISSMVPKLTEAAKLIGADGAMIEVHPNPNEALSDGFQSLTINEYEKLVKKL